MNLERDGSDDGVGFVNYIELENSWKEMSTSLPLENVK